MSRLDEYRRRRNFSRTREPSGDARGSEHYDGLFVVHKHDARQLHYDLRLEHDGVLESWAVPKGPSLEVGVKRLAVHVEDHPLEYGEFEGTIPKKEYGGGTVMLWDRGHWRRTKRSDGRIDFQLDGHKLYGAWTLTRTGSGKGDGRENWLLIKRRDSSSTTAAPRLESVPEDLSVASGRTMDEIADGSRRGVSEISIADPARIRGARRRKSPPADGAQLATLVDKVPTGSDWIYEIKFDGYRILASVDDGSVRLRSRNGKDWTRRFRNIAGMLARLPVAGARLDGEVVALGKDGISSFRRLQELLSEGRTDDLVYQVFDLTWLDGVDLEAAALVDRKKALAELLERAGFVGAATVRYTEHLEGDGREVFDNACRLGLEGIICKRADARYRRSRNRQWLKVKCIRHEELLVGGFTDPAGARSGFGALLLGARNAENDLVYAGKVGTGFSERQLRTLHARLRELETSDCPFASCPERRAVHWVKPELVAEVEFTEWTRDGRLRHPAFRGLREDKDPKEIRMPGAKQPATQSRRRKKSQPRDRQSVAGVVLTHPDRVLYPEQGLTKLKLARYYEDIEDWILPGLTGRPLSLLRCPGGRGSECFFQKHPGQTLSADIPRVAIREKAGTRQYVYVKNIGHLVGLVQVGTLELHAWGCRVDDVERPDMLVFDLDPGPEVSWDTVLEATRSLKARLEDLSLAAFLRTTGGKGLHIVVPLEPKLPWDQVKAFAQAVATRHAADDPKRLTTNMSKARRRGRIFIDYLRNGRGATAIASYSTRAREGAPVAVPVRWDELKPSLTGNRYDVGNLRRRLTALRGDPWDGFEQGRRVLTREMMSAVGAAAGKRR